MFFELPTEILHKIFSFLYPKKIYYIILSSKKIYKLNYHLHLVPLYICQNIGFFDSNLSNININTIINENNHYMYDLIHSYNYTQKEYIIDILDCILNMNYYHKKYKYKNNNFLELINKPKFNYFQDNLFEKKNNKKHYIHSIYRIPFKDYRILKRKNSQLLALIY